MNLEFLSQNSGALTIIFSGLVSPATITYAILTWRLVSETRRMREYQTEPKIFVYIQIWKEGAHFVEMVIHNVGLGPAHAIKFKVNPDFEYRKGKFLSDLGLIKRGLSHLAPGQKIDFFLTNLLEKTEEKGENPFEINVIYKDGMGKSYEDAYLIDFSPLIGLTHLGYSPLYSIAKNMEEIKREILKIAYKREKYL